NRTVKQDRADDSAQPGVKVGHRQTTQSKKPLLENREAAFYVYPKTSRRDLGECLGQNSCSSLGNGIEWILIC
ncbi:hypothetical protein, partial [Aromatoleum sp.]|uniref:hypothetical protein n=1 Tax=Aromatoleum sp. TaxID=2307007 RepID=UPI002FC94A8A